MARIAQTHMLMGYSKNQKPAKDFLRWIHSKPVFDQWFTSQQGIPPFGRLAGYAGPPNRKAAEVVSKYIIVDMYAKAIQGMAAEEAAKWAHAEVAKAYA